MCSLLSELYLVSEPTYSATALVVSGRNSFILVQSHLVEVRDFNTRLKYQFNLSHVTNSNSISFLGPSMWLKLPNAAKKCQSPSGFVRLCKYTVSGNIISLCSSK